MQLATRSVKAILGATTIGSLTFTDPTFAAAQTFLGNAANNALGGQVQVQITVNGGKITAIDTPLTLSGRNAQYANYAVPTLTSLALAAQSANIQGVSGASYVSAAWKQSLASAIAKAGVVLTGGTSSTISPATPVPAKSVAPVAPTAPAPRYGGESEGIEHEDGEGDDGPIAIKPPRDHRVHPVSPTLPKPTSSAAPTIAPTTTSLGLTMGAGVIKKTITCVKGSSTKTVKALNPRCPAGYTLKKK